MDVLSNLKISPDYIVGESFGELAAAYAEGALTAEEAILSAYAIGSVLTTANVTLNLARNGKSHTFFFLTNAHKTYVNIFLFQNPGPALSSEDVSKVSKQLQSSLQSVSS